MNTNFFLAPIALAFALVGSAVPAQTGGGAKMTEPVAAPQPASPTVKPMTRHTVKHRHHHVAQRTAAAQPTNLSRPNKSSLSRATVKAQVQSARNGGTLTPAGEAPLPAGERPVK